ncbi:MAG: pyridoxamine 5'-phosphate oxidase family protein [Myxococcota bacterium]
MYETLQQWLEQEKDMGAPNPMHAVLATAYENEPHSRVVALRNITDDEGILFFTQSGTQKVQDMKSNPQASMTFWLGLSMRQAVLSGHIQPLSQEENVSYWQSYPKWAQLRFLAYAPTSGQPIKTKLTLEKARAALEAKFQTSDVPYSEHYLGFRFIPSKCVFYRYRSDELSDVIKYTRQGTRWQTQILSP